MGKNKHPDIKAIRDMIETQREFNYELSIKEGERIARKIIERVAKGDYSITENCIKVEAFMWKRHGNYDEDTVNAKLRQSGLRIDPHNKRYGYYLQWQQLVVGEVLTVYVDLYEFANPPV